MKTQLLAFAFVAAATGGALFACSNGGDGDGDNGLPMADASTSSDGSTASDGGGGGQDTSTQGHDSATPGTDSSSPGDDSSVDTNIVVINEISGKGENWVELFNAGSTALDISGYALADEEKDASVPDLSNAVAFPSGTTLSPNSYVVVVELADDAGPNAVCPDGGQSYCFGATWGVSNTRGENVYILDSQQNVATQVAYPANTVQSGQTWGRVPNGTGTFQTNLPTPGATNVAN